MSVRAAGTTLPALWKESRAGSTRPLAFVDRSDFICAYSGDEFIGFLKLFTGRCRFYLQLNSKVAHYDKRPSNALLAKRSNCVQLTESAI